MSVFGGDTLLKHSGVFLRGKCFILNMLCVFVWTCWMFLVKRCFLECVFEIKHPICLCKDQTNPNHIKCFTSYNRHWNFTQIHVTLSLSCHYHMTSKIECICTVLTKKGSLLDVSSLYMYVEWRHNLHLNIFNLWSSFSDIEFVFKILLWLYSRLHLFEYRIIEYCR